MRFGLLGPLTVVGEHDVVVPLAGSRLRVLLSALLLHANTPVSSEALAEAVWDGAPPPSALATLRSHVRRLRRALGPVAGERIEARDPGYLIRADPAELDVLRFEALCRDTGVALRTGAWAEAWDAAAGALGLWRGAPLLDVPSQALHDGFVPRLEQLRAQVLEDHAEAGLALGRHAQLVQPLRELSAQYPLRERFHAQLMLALYRSGRQAEALEVYQQVRRMLVDQLGTEPGAQLCRLHERILAGDEADPATSEPVAQPSTDVPALRPRQLPAAAGHFTGRSAELEWLTRLPERSDLAGGWGTVVIWAIDGMAGVGKTALAVYAAHRLAAAFPDGQLFADLHSYTPGHPRRGAGEALEAFLRALGVPAGQIPREVEERAALYRQHLAGTRTLIVLDNAGDEAQVRPLLPGDPGCLVLVTSRRRLKGLDDARNLSLGLLPLGDAVALLRAVAGGDRIPADDPALDEVARLCGCLPLALRIAGALLRHRAAWSLRHLARLLQNQHRRVRVLSDGERDLGAVFDLSYAALDERHRLMFRRLGLVPGTDADAFAAAALMECDPGTATGLLDDLVDHNLLIEHSPGRYRLHDLIRAHAHSLAEGDPPDDGRMALDRLLDYYQHTAGRAEELVSQYHSRPVPSDAMVAHTPALPDAKAAWAWLRTERADLLAALEHVTEQGEITRVLALTAGLATLLRTDGPWTQAADLHAAAAAAAARRGDDTGQATALIESGRAQALMSDYSGAAVTMRAALKLYRRAGEQHGQANVLTALGQLHTRIGDTRAALQYHQQSQCLYVALGDRRGQATTQFRLGYTRRMLGDFSGASRDLQQALEVCLELGERRGQADALTELGQIRLRTGDAPGAVRNLERALQLQQELADRHGQAGVLLNLGQTRISSGDYPGAVRDLQESLRLQRDLGERYGQGAALAELGTAQRLLGDHRGALRATEEALALFRSLGAHGAQAWALNHHAAALNAAGDPRGAVAAYHDALRLAREAHQPDDEAAALEGIGEHQLSARDTDTAVLHLHQALEIFQRLGMALDAARVRARLASLAAH